MIKTVDTPHLIRHVGTWVDLALKIFAGKKWKEKGSEKAGVQIRENGKRMEGWLQLVGIENSITCPQPARASPGRRVA